MQRPIPKNNKSVIFLTAFLPLMVLVLSGCAYSGAGRNRTAIKIEPWRISTPKLNDNVNLTVEANTWRGKPKSLKKHITPFYLEIHNGTDKNIIISDSDFVLLDEQRNQYNSISPNTAANIVESANRRRFYVYPRVSIGIGTSFHHDRFHYYGHHHYPFYRPYHYFDDYPYQRYRRSYYEPDLEDIYSRALTFGTLRPGSTLSGYIYFKKIPASTKELTLEAGYKIKENSTAHKLDFHFDLIEVYYK
ncbi:MAG: hypothetical protein GWN50_04715 [Candidatus Dadabacteria bacterium]|nr:hypothetical protein [Candidatus Dadabacteria bacterium]